MESGNLLSSLSRKVKRLSFTQWLCMLLVMISLVVLTIPSKRSNYHHYAASSALIREILNSAWYDLREHPNKSVADAIDYSLSDHPQLRDILENDGVLYVLTDSEYWKNDIGVQDPAKDKAIALWIPKEGSLEAIWQNGYYLRAVSFNGLLQAGRWEKKDLGIPPSPFVGKNR